MSHEVRITVLENSMGHINDSLIKLDKKMDKMGEDIKEFVCAKIDIIDKKVDFLDKKVDFLDKKVDFLDQKVGNLDKKVNVLDGKIEKLDVKIDSVEVRVGLEEKNSERLVSALEKMNDRFWSAFLWLTSLSLGSTVGLAGLIAKAVGWL